MAKYEPFFKEKPVRFKERFPNIDTYNIVITQDSTGHFSRDGKPTIQIFNEKKNLPSEVRCINPKCQRGGLQLELFLDSVKKDTPFTYESDFYCNGDEGTPGGRKIGIHCGNSFVVKIEANTPEPTS